jgi:hypothetical protein
MTITTRWPLAAILALALAAAGALGCQTPPPVVHVQAPPCECACAFQATAPQVGEGCWVSGDRMVCPLVRRTLEIEPAYPAADPRCKRQPDGTLRCEVQPPDAD